MSETLVHDVRNENYYFFGIYLLKNLRISIVIFKIWSWEFHSLLFLISFLPDRPRILRSPYFEKNDRPSDHVIVRRPRESALKNHPSIQGIGARLPGIIPSLEPPRYTLREARTRVQCAYIVKNDGWWFPEPMTLYTGRTRMRWVWIAENSGRWFSDSMTAYPRQQKRIKKRFVIWAF